MAKAAHLGTCQVCGSLQAYKNGRLAKHGYTVEGYFHGVCTGSDQKALEESKTIAEFHVKNFIQKASELQSVIDRGPEAITKVQVGRDKFTRLPIYLNREEFEVKFESAPWMNFAKKQQEEIAKLINSRLYWIDVANQLSNRIQVVFGKPLRDRIIEEKKEVDKEVYRSYSDFKNRMIELRDAGKKYSSRRIRNGGGWSITIEKGE